MVIGVRMLATELTEGSRSHGSLHVHIRKDNKKKVPKVLLLPVNGNKELFPTPAAEVYPVDELLLKRLKKSDNIKSPNYN